MCGRSRCTLRADDFPRACGIGDPSSTRSVQMDRYRPRYNVAPGSYMPVVRRENGQGETIVQCMKWGLIPSFTKKTQKPDHYKMFNARSESVCEKASFRRLVPNNRCLVVVEGFYEWKKDGSKKQPYYVHFKNGQPLVFAALYDSWGNMEGEILYTFTILTTCSSSALQWLHDRMPVILGDKSSIDAWLNGSGSSKPNTLLKPYEDSDLAWYPVTPAMGKPSFDGLECIIEIPLKKEETNPISKFFAKKRVDSEQESDPQIKPEAFSDEDLDESLKEEEPHIKRKATSDEDESLKEAQIKPEASSAEDPDRSLKEEETGGPVTVSEDDIKNLKSESSPFAQWEAEKRGTKREYKEGNVKNLGVSKKKGKVKNAGQNQLTMLSYFGKK